MSHANGKVKFLSDSFIMYYEYDGTSDLILNCLYDTYEEMKENWRKQPINKCICGKDEPVEIGTDYGYGSYWAGMACRHCRAVTSPIISSEWNDDEGLPEWWIEK